MSVNEAGQVGSTIYSHDAAGRVIRIIAPVPPAAMDVPRGDVLSDGTLVRGCRALNIGYTLCDRRHRNGHPGWVESPPHFGTPELQQVPGRWPRSRSRRTPTTPRDA